MLPPAPAPAKGKLPVKDYDQKLQNTLVQAVVDNNIESVKRLLKFKPRVDVNGTNQYFEKPLDLAVRKGNTTIAELLLENGADPNLKTLGGLTPGKLLIAEAVERGDADMVQLLIKFGADIHIIQKEKSHGMVVDRKLIDLVPNNHPRAEKIKYMLLDKTKIR